MLLSIWVQRFEFRFGFLFDPVILLNSAVLCLSWVIVF